MEATQGINTFTLTLADTEYAITLPDRYRAGSIQARDSEHTLRVAWQAGKVAAPTNPYGTVKPGAVYTIAAFSGGVIYLASPDAGAVVELEIYYDAI